MTKINFVVCFVAVLCSLLSSIADAFTAYPLGNNRRVKTTSLVVNQAKTASNPDDSSDFPPEEQTDEYTGSVDWDAEWKKVMREQKKGAVAERPGKDFYKSEAELAAIRAANKATRQVDRVAERVIPRMPTMPTWNALKGDWKFWIGVLAIISIGTSLLAASGGPSEYATDPESFYI